MRFQCQFCQDFTQEGLEGPCGACQKSLRASVVRQIRAHTSLDGYTPSLARVHQAVRVLFGGQPYTEARH